MPSIKFIKKSYATLILVSFLFACTSGQSLIKNDGNQTYNESNAIIDARKFFTEHPEYLTSPVLEKELFNEFAKVTTVPAYKEMSMYQLLLISQDHISR